MTTTLSTTTVTATPDDDVQTSEAGPFSKKLLRKIKEYTKNVEKNNKKFKKLSKREQRITIAKDVIDQIKLKRLSPTEGIYVSPVATNDSVSDWVGDVQVGALIADRKCHVCALGAMFVSAIDQRDNITMNKLDSYSFDQVGQEQLHGYLGDIFDVKQLQLIEVAFETDDMMIDCDTESSAPSRKKLDAASNFGGEHSRADKRLIAIMKNIIKHDGKFIP